MMTILFNEKYIILNMMTILFGEKEFLFVMMAVIVVEKEILLTMRLIIINKKGGPWPVRHAMPGKRCVIKKMKNKPSCGANLVFV